MRTILFLSIASVCLPTPHVHASVKTSAVRYVLRKFGLEAGEQAVKSMSRRIGTLSVRYGDNVAKAFSKVGPQALHAIEKSQKHGRTISRLFATYGARASHIVTSSKALRLVTQHGDDAAKVMARFPGIASPVISNGGRTAVKALAKVTSGQTARRIALMSKPGRLLATSPHRQGLLDVIAKTGEKGAAFIWKNKGKLAVATVAAAFIVNPRPFIDGTVDLATGTAEVIGKHAIQPAVESVVKPLAEIPLTVTSAVAHSVNWNLVLSVCGAALALVVLCKVFGKRLRKFATKYPGGQKVLSNQ